MTTYHHIDFCPIPGVNILIIFNKNTAIVLTCKYLAAVILIMVCAFLILKQSPGQMSAPNLSNSRWDISLWTKTTGSSKQCGTGTKRTPTFLFTIVRWCHYFMCVTVWKHQISAQTGKKLTFQMETTNKLLVRVALLAVVWHCNGGKLLLNYYPL